MNTICVFIEKIARTTQTKKISKNLPEQKSRNPLCIKGFWDFLFDEKLRETREKLSKKRSNAEPGKKEKSLENIVFSRPPRYDRFDTSPYMKLSFDRNHQIFNCFRNFFRNALLCCFRSAEKVRCCKAFQGFCDRCARKFSSSFCPGYSTFQQQKTSES